MCMAARFCFSPVAALCLPCGRRMANAAASSQFTEDILAESNGLESTLHLENAIEWTSGPIATTQTRFAVAHAET
jgi:hypothetical protein